MKRKELFEFEDYSWLPSPIRNGITNLIAVLHRLMGTPSVIAGLIDEIREQQSIIQIVDLGSGSGGPMLDVIKIVNDTSDHQPINLVLTDLHPSPDTVSRINADENLHNVRYHKISMDATNLSAAPKGVKTMIASFHHMTPSTAKGILKSAQNNREPIMIYEIAENNVPFLLWLLLLPLSLAILFLMTWVMTPFVKNLTINQVLFTYLIPIIPIVYAWDGQASLMRTYTKSDVNELLDDIKIDDYEWRISSAKKQNGKSLGYYIMGLPND